MKLTINLAEFEAPTASELIKSVWELNTFVAPQEIYEVCTTISTYICLAIHERVNISNETFDATLDDEEAMMEVLQCINDFKSQYDFPVKIEGVEL